MLRVQWLSSISPILWDFQLLTMEFVKNNQQHKWHHSLMTLPVIQKVSLQHLDNDIYNSNLGLFLYSIEGEKLEASDLTQS